MGICAIRLIFFEERYINSFPRIYVSGGEHMNGALYLRDPYLRTFDAEVIEVVGCEVVLSHTAFYPQSGGQPSDTGVLTKGEETYRVVDVRKREGRIVHVVDHEGIQPGDGVEGNIDWDRRYLLMRYHTAAHVLSAVIHNATGAEITGNQLGEDKARIDFNLEQFDRDAMKTYEQKANELVKANKPVTIRFISREEAVTIPSLCKLAKGLPLDIQEIRVITIEGLDEQACGGCHVKNTSEVGMISITAMENKGKNNRRLYFMIEK